jgi:type IV secretion system protein TrbL
MSRFSIARLAVLGLLALLVLPVAAGAQQGALDGVVRSYSGLSQTWLVRLTPVAQTTFVLLAGIEFALAGLVWGLRANLDGFAKAMVQKVMVLSFCYGLIYLFPVWIPRIVSSFERAGQAASGVATVNPSQVLDQGILLSALILLSVQGLGFLSTVTGSFVAAITALIVLLAYTAIAAQLCLVLVESYIVLTGGVLLLGFAGSSITAPLADRFISYAVRVGVKIFFLLLLTGVGFELADNWFLLLQTGSVYPADLRPYMEVLAGSVVFALIVWRIPNDVAAHLTDGVSFRLAEALRGE